MKGCLLPQESSTQGSPPEKCRKQWGRPWQIWEQLMLTSGKEGREGEKQILQCTLTCEKSEGKLGKAKQPVSSKKTKGKFWKDCVPFLSQEQCIQLQWCNTDLLQKRGHCKHTESRVDSRNRLSLHPHKEHNREHPKLGKYNFQYSMLVGCMGGAQLKAAKWWGKTPGEN